MNALTPIQDLKAVKALDALLSASEDDMSPELMKQWDGLQKMINIAREHKLGDGFTSGILDALMSELDDLGFNANTSHIQGKECYWLRRMRRIQRNSDRRSGIYH